MIRGQDEKKKIKMKALYILMFLMFGSCSSKNKSIDIKGFWQVTKENIKLKKNIKTYYCEIDNGYFLVWENNINYLPPFKYSIIDDSLVLKLLKPDGRINDLDSLVQGKLIVDNQNSFYIIKKNERIKYIRSSYDMFFKKTKHYWVNDTLNNTE